MSFGQSTWKPVYIFPKRVIFMKCKKVFLLLTHSFLLLRIPCCFFSIRHSVTPASVKLWSFDRLLTTTWLVYAQQAWHITSLSASSSSSSLIWWTRPYYMEKNAEGVTGLWKNSQLTITVYIRDCIPWNKNKARTSLIHWE